MHHATWAINIFSKFAHCKIIVQKSGYFYTAMNNPRMKSQKIVHIQHSNE